MSKEYDKNFLDCIVKIQIFTETNITTEKHRRQKLRGNRC